MHVRWHSALVNAIKTDQKMFKITYFQILRKKTLKNHTFHFQEEQQLVVEKKRPDPFLDNLNPYLYATFVFFVAPKVVRNTTFVYQCPLDSQESPKNDSERPFTKAFWNYRNLIIYNSACSEELKVLECVLQIFPSSLKKNFCFLGYFRIIQKYKQYVSVKS